MSEAPSVPNLDSEFLRVLSQWREKDDVSLAKKQKWSLGSYNIENLAQDQAIIKIKKPDSRIETYYGRKVGTDEDSQSVYTEASLVQTYEALSVSVKKLLERWSNRDWDSDESFAYEETAPSVPLAGQVGEQDVDTITDEESEWTADQLYSEILEADPERDMSGIREMVLLAEDTGFTVAQSGQLSPWLLDFAERTRNSSDPQDEAAVWSAIRTGASMLRPHDVDNLRALLEPGHSIETSLVTVKMIGRIFEAQPPADVDEHSDLADEVFRFAESLLNPYAITISQSAAMSQLAIYALAAMASSKTQQIVEIMQQLDVAWFTQQTLGELRELRNNWARLNFRIAGGPLELLDRAIQSLT